MLLSFLITAHPLVLLCALHLIELTEGGQVLEGLSGGKIGQVVCCEFLEGLRLAVETMFCDTRQPGSNQYVFFGL